MKTQQIKTSSRSPCNETATTPPQTEVCKYYTLYLSVWQMKNGGILYVLLGKEKD